MADREKDSAAAAKGRLPRTLEWVGGSDGHLRMLDQTRLPTELLMRDCRSAEEVWQAIRELCVRGAPAIGVAAAYGLCLGTREHRGLSPTEFREKVRSVGEYLCSSRPTAVNLAWAVARVIDRMPRVEDVGSEAAWDAMLAEAHAILAEDAECCRRIGLAGAHLIPDGGGVLTHCNAGALATAAYGTALSLMYAAHEQGRRFRVYADETRPLLQGARLTAYELSASGIDVTVICDSAAASLMRAGRIQVVVVGADRIAANGDVANKIGTYSVAVAAWHHNIPLYVAAPRSTFDLGLASGALIPIEERPEAEVRSGLGRTTVAAGAGCWNPAFDVTPAELVAGIVTEKGLLEPVTEPIIRRFFG
ncbi:MAG: S-methyl-5-thioribose-1-phosphate isomerase [Phycisphaerae bacterium]|nr:S-methyl-5-thioribose-1-phosphate isomerase [Phycisphaerae bacterium]